MCLPCQQRSQVEHIETQLYVNIYTFALVQSKKKEDPPPPTHTRYQVQKQVLVVSVLVTSFQRLRWKK